MQDNNSNSQLQSKSGLGPMHIPKGPAAKRSATVTGLFGPPLFAKSPQAAKVVYALRFLHQKLFGKNIADMFVSLRIDDKAAPSPAKRSHVAKAAAPPCTYVKVFAGVELQSQVPHSLVYRGDGVGRLCQKAESLAKASVFVVCPMAWPQKLECSVASLRCRFCGKTLAPPSAFQGIAQIRPA